MRVSKEGVALTSRNREIRECIAKALIELMAHKNLDDLTVTEITKKANVSRMTFYKYYKSKKEVLEDYMYEIVNEYVKDAARHKEIGHFREYTHIYHGLSFLKQYSEEIRLLVNANQYGLIIHALNEYMDRYLGEDGGASRYDLYYYAGALCNVYVKWIMSDMQESVETMAEIIYKHLTKIK